MKKLVYAVCLFSCAAAVRAESAAGFITPAPAAHVKDPLRKIRWIRRATLAGTCFSETVLDSWALSRAASNPHLRLSGPFINNGKPQYGEFIGVFGGACALSAFVQERHVFARRETFGLDRNYIIENVGGLGFSLWEASHLTSLAHDAPRVEPGTLAIHR